MRWAPALVLAIALTGCGAGQKPGTHAVQTGKAQAPHAARLRCTSVSLGFRACTAFGLSDERSRIQRRHGASWEIVAGPADGRHGWWRRIVASPDRKTLLAQWSGECEIQSSYLVSTETGKARPIFRGRESTAAGWSRDGRARVRLPASLYGADKKIRFQAGIYLVDPKTLAISLERSIPQRHGC